ncbi:MAG: hypothetical protein EOR81_10870 [Mesorhizobium sp.]|nr:MAG: hypothetical protein EOR81_10870 [Mesorhizobium sp.]
MTKLGRLTDFLKKPAAIGALTFIATMIVVGMFMGPTTCNSGWASGSIGRRGACSHHGGVNHGPAQLRFITSILFGVAAGIFANKIQNGRPENSSPEALKASDSGGTICPTCGSTMRALVQNGRIQLKCMAHGCGYERRYR